MRGKWLLFSGVVILAAMAAGALSVLRKPAAEPPAKVEAAAAAPSLGDEIGLNGKIQVAHIKAVRAPVDGVVDSWEVEAGQDVVEGQPLGRVRNSALESAQELAQLELDRAQTKVTSLEGSILAARLEAARADADAVRAKGETQMLEKQYLREQNQFKEGALARLKFEKTEAAYNAARQEAATAAATAALNTERVTQLDRELALAKKTLDEKTATLEDAKSDVEASIIVAPVDGTVLSLKVEAGGEVNRAMLDLIQLGVDPAILDVVVQPEPAALKAIQPGQPAMVLVPEVTSEGLLGEVKAVNDNEAIVEFTSPNPAIKHGMQAGVRIRIAPTAPAPGDTMGDSNAIPRK